ncbi:hypothetical protein [Paenibacillus methanolicus]|uniref:Uncharacterized protein n=1 Tax=Paenibacillus methanolicus TaxID=582686 RepID=A0A5S5C3Y1_9BACL|nr:hypothetical protein [Paenibacillus methanolicus]TYP74017.1 hypothetical protein BCM02_106298 [Paenibacillus methanolicus]
MILRIGLWAVFILPFLTLLLLRRDLIRQYLPAAMFVTIVNVILYEVAWEYGWWHYKQSLFAWDTITPAPLIFSAYWVVTIWIFALSFRRFWLYLMLNLAVNGLFAFELAPWLSRAGITEGTLTSTTILLILTGLSTGVYLFQLWFEREERTEMTFNMPRRSRI